MLTDADKRDIVRSWRLVVPIAETAAELFYKRLFELKPEYVELFPADMSGQRRKLVTMLSFIVKSLDWMQEDWEEEIDPEDDLALVVLAMGRRHASLYKIPDESYDFVGAALIWTLEKGKEPELALEVFSSMQQQGVVSTAITFNALISALGKGK